jgi:hypothetical protein
MHAQKCNTEKKPMRMIMHAFSEGGSNKVCELAERYKTRTGGRLPVSALFLDSTPGKPRYRRLCKGLAYSYTSNPILQAATIGVVGVPLGVKWLMYYTIFDYDRNPISKTRKQLLDHEYLKPEVYCYMFCEGDQIVSYEHIEDHYRECGKRSVGLVKAFKYKGSHVNLARNSSYWEDVKSAWGEVHKA